MRQSYSDYGLSEERAKSLLKECKCGKHRELVQKSAHMAAPDIEEYIIKSMTENRSYDKLEFDRALGRIACGRTDFYSYRRYTLAILNSLLILERDVV
ncbi:MAG: hypothetical protein HDQ95_00980 [Roseburia sp.]|nr:hypothetical protein [Roseburia sp.]